MDQGPMEAQGEDAMVATLSNADQGPEQNATPAVHRGNRFGVFSPGRPKIFYGRPLQKRQYLRSSHDYQEKLEVINFYALHGMSNTLTRYYPKLVGNDRRNMSKKIRDWLKLRTQVEEVGYSSRSNLKKVRNVGVGTSLNHDTEAIIVQWVQDMRNEGIPVATIMLQLKAKELAEEKGISANEFKASRDWCTSFKKRHGFTLRQKTRQGQDTQEGSDEALEAFSTHIHEVMLVNNITKCYNADQTGVFYEYLPKRTINARGVKTVWVRCGGKDKERATAMLLGDSEGNKYPLFIVLKQKKSTIATTVRANINDRNGLGVFVWREVFPLMEQWPSKIYGNPTAWWNEDISVAFLRFHFGSRPNMDEKILLIWDDFSAHFTDKV
ncbi:hypothetical protein DYB28_007470 [Aphanomyces astaci]|uniref:HTH CENPB-type domain-containing protein n=1 Tax=Aphanomyces astaci TaxID=112090 RepID=A0A9X8H2H4_APHAT|nr:hypothetical protein DYB28_007470 [Aphanomyces astaci]